MQAFRRVFAVAVLIGAMAVWVADAGAAVSICVPTAHGHSITSGSCSGGGTTVSLPSSEAQQQTLLSILPYLRLKPDGVDGKPTLVFSGVNVQIVNGSGATSTINGLGNLVIGYDERAYGRAQMGSHDLILGQRHGFSGFAQLIGGFGNVATGDYTTTFGFENQSSSDYAAITGGEHNVAADRYSSIAGGCANATGAGLTMGDASCSSAGGEAVLGGVDNQATGRMASLQGGLRNLASDPISSVVGGCLNHAGGGFNRGGGCVSGVETILGGSDNHATGDGASVVGGYLNHATGLNASISGGSQNVASGGDASVLGGIGNVVSGVFAAILGGTGNAVATNCGTFPDTGESC